MTKTPPLPGLGGTFRRVYLKADSKTPLTMEWRCTHCHTWVNENMVWFVTPVNRLTGGVYCDRCLPNDLRPKRRRAC